MKNEARQSITERDDLFQILEALKQNRKKRNELGELFVEGIESIKQALSSDLVKPEKILFSDYAALSDWGKDLVDGGIFPKAIRVKKELYDELSDKAEPSEIMITLSYHRTKLADVSLPENPFIVIFDRPSDFGNLGSLIRSANSFGVDLFVTHGHCVDLFEPKVIRSSLGAIFHTPVVHEESFDELEAWLLGLKRERNLVVAGTDSGGEESLLDAGLKRPVALILGNEAKGMSVNLKRISDMIVSIPLSGVVNSLNVACAGTILFWQVSRNSRS